MNTTITLVQALRDLTPEQQRELLGLRLSSVTGLKDWFDVADALLKPEAIDRALAVLPRVQLAHLADNNLTPALLHDVQVLGLADASQVYPEVVARASELRPALGTPPEDSQISLDDRRERAALEKSIILVTRIDELLELMSKRGLRTVSRGSISASDATRVSAAITGLPEDLSALLRVMRSAALVELSAGIWSVTATTEWSQAGVAARWGMLAEGWRSGLSPQLCAALTERSNWGAPLEAYIAWQFPIDSTTTGSEAQTALTQASLLGLVVDGARTPAGEAIVSGRAAEAVQTVSALLPEYIDKVLVQSDLTIISPGPLRPDLEAKLRAIASVESRSVASTYRLSSVLIARAMDAGMTAQEIEDFLLALSSTGIPQPVAYLISDVGSKHATIRVRPDGRSTLITCSESSLAARLVADVSLRALTFARESETVLRSPHDASVVMRNLHNEKYPAALESDTGEIQPWEPATAPLTGTTQTVNAISALVERLSALATPVGESDDQWLVRQIEVAIRNRTLVNVTVALPDGSSREFLIDPRGLSNGRFRGLDRKSEVERTLPLSSITAISIAEVA